MAFATTQMRRLADVANPRSLSNRLRGRRFQLFESLIASLPRPIRILDVGGTNSFWENRGWADRSDVEIVTVNVAADTRRHRNISPIVGDATDLSRYGPLSFDVVFSNSVIEHLFTFENQRRMASEIRRVGKAYWVQTPSYWFPMEPHFHIPGWQWLPLETRIAMIRRWRCGWRGPCPDPVQARDLVSEVRLMTGRELRSIFPGARLVAERFAAAVKSWIVVGGLAPVSPRFR